MSLTKEDKKEIRAIINAFKMISKSQKLNCTDKEEIKLHDETIEKCDRLILKLE